MANLMTTVEAAKLMGITRQQVHRRIVERKMKATRVGRDFLVPMSEVRKYLRNREKAAA